MDSFEERLRAIREAAKAERERDRNQHETARLLAAYREREARERLSQLSRRRMDILQRILQSLDVEAALTALRTTQAGRRYRGPEIVQNPELAYVKIVLSRKRRRWFPYRVIEDQIGIRAYDAGSVYIEVAEFHRSGDMWKVHPLTAPLPFAPGQQERVQEAIMAALLRWAQPYLTG